MGPSVGPLQGASIDLCALLRVLPVHLLRGSEYCRNKSIIITSWAYQVLAIVLKAYRSAVTADSNSILELEHLYHVQDKLLQDRTWECFERSQNT